jgi:uncharacterized membrane protein YiaA
VRALCAFKRDAYKKGVRNTEEQQPSIKIFRRYCMLGSVTTVSTVTLTVMPRGVKKLNGLQRTLKRYSLFVILYCGRFNNDKHTVNIFDPTKRG